MMNLYHYAAGLATLLFLLAVGPVIPQAQIIPDSEDTPKKILHIMSYHSPWKWTDDQHAGFQSALADTPVEYKIFQMDSKKNSTPEAQERVAAEAGAIIDSWQPDLVYVTDDNALLQVARHYAGGELPFVFSGINSSMETLDFMPCKNITGTLEHEHFVESVVLMRQIAPDIQKIAVFFDEEATWDGVKDRMMSKMPQLQGVEFDPWFSSMSYKDFQTTILDLQDKVDGIALISVFTYKDADGNNVPYQEVLRWVADNSRLPDFSFWQDRVYHGTLCSVHISGHEQGFAAGRSARAILVDGKSPASLPIQPTLKGEPYISLARARKLGVPVHARLLLAAQVVTEFEWEKTR